MNSNDLNEHNETVNIALQWVKYVNIIWLIGLALAASAATGIGIYYILFLILGAVCLITCPCIGIGIIGATVGLWTIFVAIAFGILLYTAAIASVVGIILPIFLLFNRDLKTIIIVTLYFLIHLFIVFSIYQNGGYNIILNKKLPTIEELQDLMKFQNKNNINSFLSNNGKDNSKNTINDESNDNNKNKDEKNNLNEKSSQAESKNDLNNINDESKIIENQQLIFNNLSKKLTVPLNKIELSLLVDINGDGIKDYFIEINDISYCGSGGCLYYSYVSKNKKEFTEFDLGNFYNVGLSKNKNGQLPMLFVAVHGSACEKLGSEPCSGELKWNGKEIVIDNYKSD